MNKMFSGVRYGVLLILLGLLASCSAALSNEAVEQAPSAQSGPPVITVYKAPT